MLRRPRRNHVDVCQAAAAPRLCLRFAKYESKCESSLKVASRAPKLKAAGALATTFSTVHETRILPVL